jgi:hypothetical protein
VLKHKRPLPKHLQIQENKVEISKTPGPGHYESPSSIKKNNRHLESIQDTTWTKARDLTSTNIKHESPGPTSYEINRAVSEISQYKSKALDPGNTFSNGPKDAFLTSVLKNKDMPGPG